MTTRAAEGCLETGIALAESRGRNPREQVEGATSVTAASEEPLAKECGLMRGGVVNARDKGTPQGGPLSPLLSNILLDDWIKNLKEEGTGSAVTRMTAISTCGPSAPENGCWP